MRENANAAHTLNTNTPQEVTQKSQREKHENDVDSTTEKLQIFAFAAVRRGELLVLVRLVALLVKVKLHAANIYNGSSTTSDFTTMFCMRPYACTNLYLDLLN